MIKLTTTGTHEYFAVALPKDAEKIFLDGVHSYSKNLYYFTDGSYHINLGYDELGYGAIELLGILGQGSEISEEVAEEACINIEIPEWSKYTEENPYPDCYVHVLKWMLSEKGILVENPIAYPGDDLSESDMYIHEEWQSYESNLVKAVIIKVKK